MQPGGGGYAGFALGDRAAKTYLVHSPFGGAEYAARLDGASIWVASGTNGASAGTGGLVTLELRGEVGTPYPLISSYSCNVYGPGRRTGKTSELGGGNVRLFGDGNATPVAWKTSTLETFGLAIQSSGGNPLPLTTDVLSLRIFEVL